MANTMKRINAHGLLLLGISSIILSCGHKDPELFKLLAPKDTGLEFENTIIENSYIGPYTSIYQ